MEQRLIFIERSMSLTNLSILTSAFESRSAKIEKITSHCSGMKQSFVGIRDKQEKLFSFRDSLFLKRETLTSCVAV